MAKTQRPQSNGDEEMDFETALQRLEEIVEQLEGGELGLEEALEKFGEAMRLATYCDKKLREAEAKVEEYMAIAQEAVGQPEADEEEQAEANDEQLGIFSDDDV